MSLDVYLTLPGELFVLPALERIFIRRDGATVEISREEWDESQPGREPVSVVDPMPSSEVYTANITHNLGRMAGECAVSDRTLYDALWRPDEIGITRASQLIAPLREGLDTLLADPERFKAFNPANGWGNYDLLVSFVDNYLTACTEWPEAEVQVWC